MGSISLLLLNLTGMIFVQCLAHASDVPLGAGFHKMYSWKIGKRRNLLSNYSVVPLRESE